jgi:hypothetical protein
VGHRAGQGTCQSLTRTLLFLTLPLVGHCQGGDQVWFTFLYSMLLRHRGGWAKDQSLRYRREVDGAARFWGTSVFDPLQGFWIQANCVRRAPRDCASGISCQE